MSWIIDNTPHWVHGTLRDEETQQLVLERQCEAINSNQQPAQAVTGHAHGNTQYARLLRLPRELRDLIYTELSQHRAEHPAQPPIGPTQKRYQYTAGRKDWKHIGTSEDDALPNMNFGITIQLVCRQIRDEVQDFSQKAIQTVGLSITHTGFVDWLTWTAIPVLQARRAQVDLTVTLDLYAYYIIEPSEAPIAYILRLLTRSGAQQPEGPMIGSLDLRVRMLHFECAPHDRYTPNQFPLRMRAFEGCIEHDTRHGVYHGLCEVVEINGRRYAVEPPQQSRSIETAV